MSELLQMISKHEDAVCTTDTSIAYKIQNLD